MRFFVLLAAGWAAAAVPAPSGRSVAAVVPLDAPPGLYFNGRKVASDQWREHQGPLDRLTGQFLARVQPLFQLLPDEEVLFGSDDLAYDRLRDGARLVELTPAERRELGATFSVAKPHEGLDVGARITADGGKTIYFLGNADVYPVYPGGRLEVRAQGFVAQRVVLESGPYALALEIIYGHVRPASSKPGGFSAPVGTLEGGDRWDATARELWSLGPYKGNHVHLLIRGINDLETRHYVERVRGTEPALLEYVRYRADFYNERLLPLLRAGR